jgi:hypothetical protein
MLFLVVFSALALGFYAATTTSSQLAENERRAASAMSAAESGLHFLRYELSRLDIPYTMPPHVQFEEIHMQLSGNLDGTANLGTSFVGYDPLTPAITIPNAGYIKLDPEGKQRFKARIERAGDVLVAKVTGRTDGAEAGRGIEVKFAKAKNATAIFNYGVASRGRVVTSGSSTITGLTDPTKGSVLSTSTDAEPVKIGGKLVSGDISVVGTAGDVSFSNGTSIGGTTNTALIREHHIHTGVPEPRFPDIDTTVYEKYVSSTYADGDTVLTNARIPADTNPSISGGTLKGVIFIEAPNVVKFSGGTDVQAVIVVENGAACDMVNNVIEFSGSVTASPVENLVGAEFAEIRKLKGAFIIAPNFLVRMWGNFGQVSGSVFASQFQMGGSAEGTIKGSIIQTHDLPMTIEGSADVVVASTGTTEYPPGITFGAHYTSVPGSYLEVAADP